MVRRRAKPLKQNVTGIFLENYKKKFQTDPIIGLDTIPYYAKKSISGK